MKMNGLCGDRNDGTDSVAKMFMSQAEIWWQVKHEVKLFFSFV
jgi:hypothetical protein